MTQLEEASMLLYEAAKACDVKRKMIDFDSVETFSTALQRGPLSPARQPSQNELLLLRRDLSVHFGSGSQT
jgi:hypothetical protein